MALSEADEKRVEGEVAGMVIDLRTPPINQEKEDRIGVQVAVMPEEERALVPAMLLRFVAAERRGEPLPDPLAFSGPAPPRKRGRFAWTLRLPKN
jgi:hypothetical protein